MGKNGTYCRINGTIHNLTKIQDIMDGKSTEAMTGVLMNDYGVEFRDALIFREVLKFCNNEIPEDYNEALERFREYNENNRSPRAYQSAAKVKCPRCGSTDIKKYEDIVGDPDLTSAFDYSLIYNYRCRNCWHEWK